MKSDNIKKTKFTQRWSKSVKKTRKLNAWRKRKKIY